jgi:hypothetical protein
MHGRLIRLVAALGLFATPVAAQVTAIRAGGVVDPDAGTVARDQVILIERGRITAIGSNVQIPAGATVIKIVVDDQQDIYTADDIETLKQVSFVMKNGAVESPPAGSGKRASRTT